MYMYTEESCFLMIEIKSDLKGTGRRILKTLFGNQIHLKTQFLRKIYKNNLDQRKETK